MSTGPSDHVRKVVRRAGPLLLFGACALLVTWPLATRLSTHLPLGALASKTVPLFNLWTLEWNAARLAHGYAGYWDAPIFYPERATFALSEPEAVPGLLFAGLRFLCGPVAAYNLVLLGMLVLNGFAARRLLAVLGVGWPASLCGGVLAVGASFVLGELGVLQLCALFPALHVLAELRLFLREPAGPPVLRGAAWFALLAWSCLYYALLLGVVLLPALLLLRRRHATRASVIAFVSAGVACAAALMPIASVQRRALARFERSPTTISHGSARLGDYLRPAPRTLPAQLGVGLAADAGDARALGPGAFLTALAIAGLFAAYRTPERDFAGYCALATGLAFVLSLGTHFELFGMTPYAWLERVAPGFAQLRSPYRFAAFVNVFAIVFATFGLAAFAQRLRAAHASLGLAALTLVCLVEVLPLPLPIAQVPLHMLNEAWVNWLAAHPSGAVAMVPPARSGKARDYEPIVIAMLAGLRHGHPLVNGYSGFFPRSADRMARWLQRFPEPKSLLALQRAGVRYVVAENRWLGATERKTAIAAAWPNAQARHRDRHRTIFELQ